MPRLRSVIISCRRPVHRFAPLCCLLDSSALPHPSSLFSSRAILLACRLSLRHASRPASRFSSRLSSRSPLVMSSPSCPIALPCRSACGHRSPRPACRLGWERDGTGLPISPSPARFAAAAYPGWRLACVRFLVCGLLCLLVCRHLCLYCDGEIVYMICPVAII